MNQDKLKTAILYALPVFAVAAGIFITLGPFQDHATFIELTLIFYALCIWIWRVMVALVAALAMGWGLSYIVSFNGGYLGLALLVLGLALGIVWHLRHQRSIVKKR